MIRVLIVDDSVVMQRTLSRHLAACPDLEVVGTAIDPYQARDLILELKPDVITLDIEMPRMDGLSFLERLMKHHPLPVVIVSSLTPANSAAAIHALELGAVEVLCKPGAAGLDPDLGRRLAHAVRAAAQARFLPRLGIAAGRAIPAGRPSAVAAASGEFQLRTTRQVLAIGASTGGPSAIETVLSRLPADAPGTVIVQHMPETFTGAFAARLDSVCALQVRVARDGDPIVDGEALIAPGNKHLVAQRSGARYGVRVVDGPAVHHQRPAVDLLFDSVARAAGPNAIGVILTGMGADGARGLLEMKKRGARTLAQDEASCVVFGMPREAVRLGAADEVVPLDEIPAAILRLFQEGAREAA